MVLDKHKQVKLRHGEQEIRFEQEPFPLYPGEKLNGPVQPLQIVEENTALRLKACTWPDTKHTSLVLFVILTLHQRKLKWLLFGVIHSVCDFDEYEEVGTSKGPRRRIAGEEWLFEVPAFLILPSIEKKVNNYWIGP